ncbi:MAG: hypothetical protein ACREMX_02145 [Gemmatimonadales bacterium]
MSLLTLLAARSHAQQEIGHVERIAEKKGHFVEVTSRAELWRTSGELRVPVRRAAPLLYQDIVRLRERIVIDLVFRQPGVETNVYLGSRQLADVGSYEILRDSVGNIGGLQLVVKQGVMVIEHVRGELLAVAAGIRTRIFGTTVLLAVDADDAEGTVFLREGRIDFPDYGMEATGTNRAWRLKRGQAPVELVLSGSELRPWQQEVEYTTQSVWHQTPFWQKPSFLVPAAAVVAGGIGCVAAGCFGGDQGSQGGVVITIPE